MIALVPAFQLSNLPAQDPGPILDRASAVYQTIRTLSADFVQIVANPLIGAPDTTRGKLYQMRPSHFAMRFSQPRGDRIVADGRHLWLYTPSSTPGQVIRTGIPSTGTTGPNLIGQFVERPRERYRARYLRADSLADGLADVVALVPRATDLPYSEAVVWIDRDDGLIRRIELVETSGQRRSVALRNLAVNRGVPSREFVFAPPAGSRVVDQ
ncbi:MAG TPA: outer membrane lipoprotein chaperone LolA [Gemmatimonadales bacterium]|jgi:outer membrane lipoprotein carrier protein|nr:outer membrane lipoprotein chaperone LolA [Gemmatimonadales bacterium]